MSQPTNGQGARQVGVRRGESVEVEKAMTHYLPSAAYQAHLIRQLSVTEFTALIHILGAAIPHFQSILPEKDPELADQFNRFWSGERLLKSEPELFRRLSMEMLLCKFVDSLQIYLGEALHRVFLGRPETLRSSEMVEIRRVLEHDSIQEFTAEVAAQKVDDLAYRGFAEVLDYLKARLGVTIDLDEQGIINTSYAVSVRNIIVHNDGRINRRFLRDTGAQGFELGTRFNLVLSDTLDPWIKSFDRVASAVDKGLVSKFGSDIFTENLGDS